MRKYIIGFCGKIYPAIWLRANLYGKTPESFCYSVKEVDEFIKSYYDEEDQSFYFETCPKWKKRFGITTHNEFSAYFALDGSEYGKYFQEYKTPIFVIKETAKEYFLIINESLQSIGFFRLFDTNSAYQEISMFLGNELVESTRPIPRMNDEVKISSHGFDKFSFRKDKEKIC